MSLSVENKVVPITAIDPHPDNYNTHPELQIQQLGASHEEFGQYRSVVLWARPNGRYTQVAGHGVVEAMQANGAQEVRADILPIETPPITIKRILLADNLHAQNSLSNDVMLSQLLEEQRHTDMGLAALGYDESQLQALHTALANESLEFEEAEEDEEETEPAIQGLDAPDVPYENKYAVAVMCESEQEQERIFNELKEQGYTCKVLVV